jgi:hypothetical protein
VYAKLSSVPPASGANPFLRLKQTPLWLLALFTLAGYTLIRFWLPLSPYFDQLPLPDIRTFTPSLGAGLAYGLLLGLLFIAYHLAFQRVRQMEKPPRLIAILAPTALFCLPLLQTSPFNATDIYRYIIRGRITSVYHQDPFSVPPNTFQADPLLPFAGEWANATSPYGPVWEVTAAAVTTTAAISGTDLVPGSGQANLYLGLLLFKGLGAIVHLATAWLIWLLLSQARSRSAYTLLWAWNPALLLTFVGDAHNDGLMLFWLLSGLWVMRCGRPTLGFLVMALAPLTKPIGLLPWPLFFLAIWRQLPDLRAKSRFLLLSGAGSLALTWLAFLPFGPPLDLAQRLLREASDIAGFSVTTVIFLLGRRLDSNLSIDLVSRAALGLFGLFALWLLWRTWRGRSPLRGTADIFMAYVLEALSFRIWYSVWPFPWLLLDAADDRPNGPLPYRLQVGLWFLLTSQLSVLIYGHLRVYALGADHLLAHLVGVPFVFGLPFLLPVVSRALINMVLLQFRGKA